MMFGLATFGLGLWLYTPITHDWGWRELLLPQAFRGFAQQFAVAPTVTLTLGGLSPDRLRLASGLFNLMRNLGGAIGIAACGTVLNDRANLHFLRIAEHLNATNPALADLLHGAGQRYASLLGGDALHGKLLAARQLHELAWREAQVLTFADAFMAIAVCFVVATAMVPLMRKVAPPKGPSSNAH
jgi:DHA2 family multidrug resistance protein